MGHTVELVDGRTLRFPKAGYWTKKKSDYLELKTDHYGDTVAALNWNHVVAVHDTEVEETRANNN